MDYQINNLISFSICIIIGLTFGSFISLASYRLVRSEDIIFTGSHCTKCDHKLNFKDLFPLFSWIISGGKCNYCSKNISYRYPIIEISFTLVSLLIFVSHGLTITSIIILLITICLFILIVTDIEHYIIPDQIHLALFILAILYNISIVNLTLEPLLSGILASSGALILRKIIFLWIKEDPLGFGDVKFLLVAGLFLPLNMLPIYFFISGSIGILTSVIWNILKKSKFFPFGPALAISLFICINYPMINIFFANTIIKTIFKIG